MTGPEEARPGSGGKIWRVLFVAVVAVLYGLSIFSYFRELDGRKSTFQTAGSTTGDYLAANAVVVSTDLVKGEMTLRLGLDGHGALLNRDGFTLAKELKLFVNAASGSSERVLAKGRPPGTIDVTIQMREGEAQNYPFDHHKTELELYLTTSDAAGDPVPIALEWNGAQQGLVIDATPAPESSAGHIVVDIDITRASTTLVFAFFIMFVQWGLAIGLVVLFFALTSGRRKSELSMFSWMGAMLFAFPALRNASPGIPGIGTLSDFMAFFWAEGIVALVLITAVTIWLREPKKP